MNNSLVDVEHSKKEEQRCKMLFSTRSVYKIVEILRRIMFKC